MLAGVEFTNLCQMIKVVLQPFALRAKDTTPVHSKEPTLATFPSAREKINQNWPKTADDDWSIAKGSPHIYICITDVQMGWNEPLRIEGMGHSSVDTKLLDSQWSSRKTSFLTVKRVVQNPPFKRAVYIMMMMDDGWLWWCMMMMIMMYDDGGWWWMLMMMYDDDVWWWWVMVMLVYCTFGRLRDEGGRNWRSASFSHDEAFMSEEIWVSTKRVQIEYRLSTE
jgi:hypothetical protein